MVSHRNVGIQVIAFMFLAFAGCAQPPVEQLEVAQKGVDAARSAGGPEYAAGDFMKLEALFNHAKAELAAQEQVFGIFRSYRKANHLLNQVRRDAVWVIDKASARKEEARTRAMKHEQELRTLLESAQKLLATAPTEGGRAELVEVKNELHRVTVNVEEIQALIDGGRYLEAKNRTKEITANAEAVTGRVQIAVERAKAITRQTLPQRRQARGLRGGQS